MNDAQKKEVNVVLPSALREASASALVLCELFISKLLDAKESTISIKVDTVNNVVYCRDSGVKEALNLLLKTKKISAFYEQLQELLINNELKVIKDDSERSLRVIEKNSEPDFEWFIDIK